MRAEPLSVPLSRLLVAFTIELDNEFERRMAEAVTPRPFRVSVVMWSNFLRFIGSGIPVGELPAAAGLPARRLLSTIGGMERWQYVFVAPPGARKRHATKRDGFGSARGLQREWIVQPTPVGVAAQELWPPLFADIEGRWRKRFGARELGELSAALSRLPTERPLPEYLPIVTGANGMVSEVTAEAPRPSSTVAMSARLAHVLLAYTLEVERDAPLSLPLAENVVHVLDASGLDVRELPRATAVSPEAIRMALTYLTRKGHVLGDRVARLTDAGAEARDATRAAERRVEREWEERFGRTTVERLRAAMQALLGQRDAGRPRLAVGLEPHPEGWRASRPHLARTQAMLADPTTGLPRHPMVLHRGGWPDGS